MRTGRQISEKKTGARIAGRGSSVIAKTTVGTRNTHKLEKDQMKASSTLKKDPLLTMLDTFATGTNLTSDLNTPEIKFENFQFNHKLSSNNGSNMEVESSRDAFEHDVDCSTVDDCLATDTSTSDDQYTLFDMSPLSRDILQADQHEQRVNIEDFTHVLGGDVATNESCITSNELDLSFLQPQTISDTFSGNGLGAAALGQPQVLEPPVLSINNESDFVIPPEVLEQMDSLFPEEPMIPNHLPENEVCSTELDMILGTHAMHNTTDLLSGALQSSGLLEYELEENENELSTVDMKPLMLTNNTQWHGSKTIVQPVNPVPESSCFVTKPLEFLNDPKQESNNIVQLQTLNPLAEGPSWIITNPLSFLNDPNHQNEMIPTPSTSFQKVEMVTPTPSTSFQKVELVTPTPSTSFSTTCPKTPSKKRPDKYEATPTGCGGPFKRQRRNSRKPLRFRDADDAFESSIKAELSNNEVHVTQVTEYAEQRLGHQTVMKVTEEESELNNITTAGRKGNRQTTSQTNLTEEEKYHRIRILNNEASKRCRQKRKATVKDMEQELQTLEHRNKVLKKKHEDLVQLRDRFQAFVNDFFRQRLASSSN